MHYNKHIIYLCVFALIGGKESIWRTVSDFECDLLNSDNNIDEACVRACRVLLSNFLKANSAMPVNGISIEESILPSYKDVK